MCDGHLGEVVCIRGFLSPQVAAATRRRLGLLAIGLIILPGVVEIVMRDSRAFRYGTTHLIGLFAPALFFKGVSDLNRQSSSPNSFGLRWENIGTANEAGTWQMVDTYKCLAIDAALYLLLAASLIFLPFLLS